MIDCKAMAVLAMVVLAFPVPNTQANAGSRDAAIAAGIIGAAIGSAMILQHQRALEHPPQKRRAPRKAAVRAQAKSEGETATKKDPFAATVAPADYAKPVSNK